ncbi:uncharacterized protein J3R85_013887 [Psidium guajava]|nr:uncharacterized protein J3R85_013887 [Psidium guajava]
MTQYVQIVVKELKSFGARKFSKSLACPPASIKLSSEKENPISSSLRGSPHCAPVSSKRLLLKLLPPPMDDYNRFHIPAFGSWDCYDGLPFTQCFDEASARQRGMLRYTCSVDRDLYVAGDLYQNDVVTPAMIVVPRRRRRRAKVGDANHDAKGRKEKSWASDFKEPTSPPFVTRPAPKPVDEDLYKISPELLYAESKKGMKYFGENGVKFSPLTVAVLVCRREGGDSGHAAWCPLVLREAGKRERSCRTKYIYISFDGDDGDDYIVELRVHRGKCVCYAVFEFPICEHWDEKDVKSRKMMMLWWVWHLITM